MPRNPELMRVFKVLRLVEQLCPGMERIVEHYDNLIFNFTDNYMKVTFMYDDGYIIDNTNDVIREATNEAINDGKK